MGGALFKEVHIEGIKAWKERGLIYLSVRAPDQKSRFDGAKEK